MSAPLLGCPVQMAQALGEAEQIGRELTASLDEDAVGCSVHATPDDIAACLG